MVIGELVVACPSPVWYLAEMKPSQNIVKRANETIGIVPSGNHRLTNLVRRLYSVILLFSQKQGDKEEYRAVLSDMLEAANSAGSNRTQVKTILRDIRAIGVDWNVREGDRHVWKNVGLIEEAGLIDGKGTPTIVTWKLPKIIRNRLLDPHGFFTRISLETMTRLKSGASIALYEICCQYASNDHGKGEGGLTFKGSVDEWMPKILGTRKTGYEYKFFKRDVLQSAIDEIHSIAGMQVELIEHKAGRKVVELQFRVFQNAKLPTGAVIENHLPDSLQNKAQNPVFLYAERIQAFGLSKSAAEKICREFAYNEAYLLKSIVLVEQREKSTNATPLRSKAAFFKQALKEGYADTATNISSTSPRALVSVKPPESAEEVRLRQEMLSMRSEIWRRYQAKSNEPAMKELLDEFLRSANSAVVTFARKGGINNMVVKTSFIEWLGNIKNF